MTPNAKLTDVERNALHWLAIQCCSQDLQVAELATRLLTMIGERQDALDRLMSPAATPTEEVMPSDPVQSGLPVAPGGDVPAPSSPDTPVEEQGLGKTQPESDGEPIGRSGSDPSPAPVSSPPADIAALLDEWNDLSLRDDWATDGECADAALDMCHRLAAALRDSERFRDNLRAGVEHLSECLAASEAERERDYADVVRLLAALAPQCEPLSDVRGVISQIDNWCTGHIAERERLQRGIEAALDEREATRILKYRNEELKAEIDRQAALATRRIEPEDVARRFHESYERLAPGFRYQTRRESAKPWEDLPENNRALMVAVAREVIVQLALNPEPSNG